MKYQRIGRRLSDGHSCGEDHAGRGHEAAMAAVLQPIERRILFAALDSTWNAGGIQHEPYPTEFQNANRVEATHVAVLADDKVLVLATQARAATTESFGASDAADRTNASDLLLSIERDI